MDTQHCLQCELHKNKIDQDGCKYCYCFFNPDKGRWVAEIENCPKLGNHSGSSEVPKDLEEASSKFATHTANGVSVEFLHEKLAFQEGAKWQKEKDDKELSEKIASAYQLGLADKEKQMMKGAVEGYISATNEVSAVLALPKGDFKKGDKVNLLFVKKD